MDNKKCIICSNSLTDQVIAMAINKYLVICPRCGRYEIGETAKIIFDGNTSNPLKVQLVSHWIRNHQSDENCPFVSQSIMDELLTSTNLPNPSTQADNLILYLGRTLKRYNVSPLFNVTELISVIGSHDNASVDYIVDSLLDAGLLHQGGVADVQNRPRFHVCIGLTFNGWQRFDELQKVVKNSTLAFMAMKFGNAQLNAIYNDLIKPSVSDCGFEIRKLDENPKAGLIDDRLRIEIRRSKFLIADLTHGNNGAYWEAGYAEGLGLPVIYICEARKFKKAKTHFDTNHHLTVLWGNTKSGRTKFAEDLKATIRATFPNDAKMED